MRDDAPWFTGSCHCGEVAFRVRVRHRRALDCSCSICRRKGLLHLLVPQDDFVLLRGEEALTLYTFHTHTAKHRFCRYCGVQAFYTPRSHPDQIDVNVRCLDDFDPSEWAIEPFDGARWEDNVHRIR